MFFKQATLSNCLILELHVKTSTDDVFQHHQDVNCDVVYKHQYVVQHQRPSFNLIKMFTNNSEVSNVDRPLDMREYYGFVKIR